MSHSAEIKIQHSPAAASCDRDGDVVTLGPDDFQRIGIRPKETRLDVIRRAASRATRSLARRQLSSPNAMTEQQLSRIAVSTYRLLDPRQREDRQSRAHVGRIRPGNLYRAGKTEFADGKILIQSCESSNTAVVTHHVNDALERTEMSSTADDMNNDCINVVNPMIPADRITASATMLVSAPPAVRRGQPGVFARLRTQASRPGLILAIIVVLLLTAGGLWNWGQSLRAWPSRLAPAAIGAE